MKFAKLIQVACLTLLLAACSRVFFVNVEGDMNAGIQFCFYKNLDDEKPRSYELREFGMQRLTGDGWKDVWLIKGPFDVTCLDYGKVSPDYKTIVPAQPLGTGKYRIGATDTKSPIGYASLTFRIDETGRPVVAELVSFRSTGVARIKRSEIREASRR